MNMPTLPLSSYDVAVSVLAGDYEAEYVDYIIENAPYWVDIESEEVAKIMAQSEYMFAAFVEFLIKNGA